MTLLERPLDTVESVFAAASRIRTCAAAVLVAFSGRLDPNTCARALATLPARHPRLRTRVVRAGDAWTFTTSGVEPMPFVVAPPGSPDDWPRILEDELRYVMDESVPSLLAATFVPSRGEGAPQALVLRGQHAAFDFQSMVEIACDALTVAGAISSGREPDARPRGEAAVPLDERLPPATEASAAPEPPADAVLPPFEGRASLGDRRERLALHAIEASTCRALVDRSRAERSTVTGIVAAAALEALRKVFGPLPAVRIATSVGARALAIPPVAPDEVGCFVSNLETVHSLADDVALWDRARAFSSDVRTRIERGEWHARLRALSGRVELFARQMDMLTHDETTQGRTNALDVVSFGKLVPPPASPLKLGPVYGAISNQGIGHCLWLGFGSIEDALHFTLGWVSPLVSDVRARSFLSELDAFLHEAAGGV